MLVVLKLFKIFLILLVLSPQSFACQKLWGDSQFIDTCEIKANTKGEPILLKHVIPKFSLKKKNLRINFNVNSIASLQGVKFTLKNGTEQVGYFEFPMFSDHAFGIIKSDLVTELTIPKSSITLTNKKNLVVDTIETYIAPKKNKELKFKVLSVTSQVKAKKGKVSITFDDGYQTNLLASRLTSQRGLNATAYIIPQAIGQKDYLTDDNVNELLKNGWALGSHEVTPVTEIKKDEVEKYLSQSVQKLNKKFNQKESSRHFAYPLGKTSKDVILKARKVFNSARIAGGGMETLPVGDRHRLRVINVFPHMNPETLYQKAKIAVDNGDWAIFMFHYLDDPSKGNLNYSVKSFTQFLDLMKNLKDSVLPVHKVLSKN